MPQPSSTSTSTSLPQPPDSLAASSGPNTSDKRSVGNDPPTVSFPEAEGGGHTDLETDAHLDGASVALGNLEKGAQAAQKLLDPRPPRGLNKLTASIDAAMKGVADARNSELASNAEAACKSDDLKAIRESVNMFVDSLPGLLRTLEDIASVHPFIKVAVGAFRVVVELHLKRQSNDKQINVLFVQMRDTMEVLVLLRDIKDGEPIGHSGQTIKARLGALVNKTADDIKECANVCDAYAKKGTIAKVLKSSMWEDKLKGWLTCFAERRKEFTMELSVHASVAIGEVHKKLASIDVKMELFLKWFSDLVSADQQGLAELVKGDRFGGPEKVVADPTKLRELLKQSRSTTTTATRGKDSDGGQRNTSGTTPKGVKLLEDEEFARLKRELSDSPEQAIQHNLDVFRRKFEMQQREFTQEVGQMMHDEGTRVIEELRESGAHTKINDPDIREIWREMQWPGHVKARHFVLALRDYYRQAIGKKHTATDEDVTSGRVARGDKWALGWINVSRLQAITEAFDDDASGFITIAEVNDFTASRPEDWSLLHWLAYWAIGWQLTVTEYRDEIVAICAKMFALRTHLHPSNRAAVNTYLRGLWTTLSLLTLSLTPAYLGDNIGERFRSYVETEEQRLREKLETVQYVIDGFDTLSLITGQGRIEKRYHELQALFKQQKLDPAQQFKVFASALLGHWNDTETFLSLENLLTVSFLEVDYDEIEDSDDQDNNASGLLLYPSAPDNIYFSALTEEVTTPHSPGSVDAAVRPILGRWIGFQYSVSQDRYTYPMRVFHLHASQDGTSCEARGVNPLGGIFTLSVEHATRVSDGKTEYTFTHSQVLRLTVSDSISVHYMTGTLDEDGKKLSGRWGYDKDDQPHAFTLWREVEPVKIANRPHPEEFKKDKVKALWKYALTVVHNEVRRRLFSWSYIKERRDVRRKFLKLAPKGDSGMSSKRWRHLGALHRMLTADDCGYDDVFDFCDTPTCIGCEVKTPRLLNSPHLPTHDLVKIRTVIVEKYEIGSIIRGARAGLEDATSVLDMAEKKGAKGDVLNGPGEGKEGEGPKRDRDVDELIGGDMHEEEVEDGLVSEYEDEDEDEDEDEEPENQGQDMSNEEKCQGMSEGNNENELDKDQAGDHKNTEPQPEQIPESGTEPNPEPELQHEQEDMGLACLGCKAVVARPCFYCIDCPWSSPQRFICWDCDAKAGGFNDGKHHKATHNLVRCIHKTLESPGDTYLTVETRLGSLEAKVEGLAGQMEEIKELLHTLVHGRSTDLS
ncbi:hypothetical protein GSI_04773 [Ganoderma sinense ZZ0214-1]|uniref:Uncharacterized protein n=1 Tax=Ganoderma sinense ZZ0214-1 TaxID=1077348 RepID=A0A2G8SHT3_9APHY|nr:hypothetical protein GSI_04773 [Ganoderma sinense ZZ0214-1]